MESACHRYHYLLACSHWSNELSEFESLMRLVVEFVGQPGLTPPRFHVVAVVADVVTEVAGVDEVAGFDDFGGFDDFEVAADF